MIAAFVRQAQHWLLNQARAIFREFDGNVCHSSYFWITKIIAVYHLAIVLPGVSHARLKMVWKRSWNIWDVLIWILIGSEPDETAHRLDK